jgi:hypothetical protein
MTENAPDDLTTLLRVHTPFEAHTLAAVLKDAGIEVFVFDSAYAGFGTSLAPGKGDVPIQVRRREVERARRVLSENVSDSVDIDWNEIDLGRREDSLPLRSPGRMPPAARIAFAAVILVVLLGLLAFALTLFMP